MKSEKQVFWSAPDRYLLGTKITMRRLEMGLTIEDLAVKAGESPRTVLQLEFRVPRKSDEDAKWEAALEVEPGWLRASFDRDTLAAARAAIYDLRSTVASGFGVRMRREFLGLSIDELSVRTSLPPSLLRDFEDSLPESTDFDEIVESALFLPEGAIRRGVTDSDVECRVIDDLIKLSRRLIIRKRTRHTTREMVLQRYGALGEDFRSCRAIGERFGISAPAVQSRLTGVRAPVSDEGFFSPAIDILARLVEPRLPAKTRVLTEYFQPFLGGKLSIGGVNSFASDFLEGPIFRNSSGVARSLSGRRGHKRSDGPPARIARLGAAATAEMADIAAEATVEIARFVPAPSILQTTAASVEVVSPIPGPAPSILR